MKRATADLGAETTLLLTCTVVPRVKSHLVVKDPSLRLRMYMASIEKWLQAVGSAQVLVVDNSGSSELKRRLRYLGERVSLVSYSGSDHGEVGGKGAGEAEILAVASQWLARNSPGTKSVVKVTGRLFVPNLGGVLGARTPTEQNWAQCQISNDLRSIDSRLFRCSRDVLADWGSLGHCVDEPGGVYLEHVVARRLLSAVHKDVIWVPFLSRPAYAGMSGSTGASYGWRREFIVNQLRRPAAWVDYPYF